MYNGVYFIECRWTFLGKFRQLLCLVFIHSYPVEFVNKGFEIIDMKKCVVIPLNIYD